MFTKKKFVEKNLRQKNFSKKKNLKKFFNIILAIFLYLKKNSVEIRLIFEKKKKIEKNFENNFCIFFVFEKKVG